MVNIAIPPRQRFEREEQLIVRLETCLLRAGVELQPAPNERCSRVLTTLARLRGGVLAERHGSRSPINQRLSESTAARPEPNDQLVQLWRRVALYQRIDDVRRHGHSTKEACIQVLGELQLNGRPNPIYVDETPSRRRTRAKEFERKFYSKRNVLDKPEAVRAGIIDKSGKLIVDESALLAPVRTPALSHESIRTVLSGGPYKMVDEVAIPLKAEHQPNEIVAKPNRPSRLKAPRPGSIRFDIARLRDELTNNMLLAGVTAIAESDLNSQRVSDHSLQAEQKRRRWF